MSDLRLILDACPETLHADAEEAWRQRQPTLRRLLARLTGRADLSAFCRHAGHDMQIVGLLETERGTLIAYGHGGDCRAALDAMIDDLRGHVDRQLLRRRLDLRQRRQRRRGATAQATEALLDDCLLDADRALFEELTRRLLGNLRSHAARELRLARYEGRIFPGALSVDDLLDDVLLRAWERRRHKPGELSWERWLARLIHSAIQRHATASPHLAEIAVDALAIDTGSVEDDWTRENEPMWPDEDDAVLTVETLLPDDHTREPWEDLALEEQRRWLLAQLAQQPEERRRAFTLHALEDWDLEAIACLQGRSIVAVQEDVVAVRQALRAGLQAISAAGEQQPNSQEI